MQPFVKNTGLQTISHEKLSHENHYISSTFKDSCKKYYFYLDFHRKECEKI